VVERGGRLRLTQQVLADLFVTQVLRGQQLDGDLSFQGEVVGQIDLPIPPAPSLRLIR